jgi:hypothetical protein
MELKLTRTIRADTLTIGELSNNDTLECFILEDKDRGLHSDMPIAELMATKVKHETAIPTGRYEIAVTFSERFKKPLPLLLNVTGYEGVRIHPGNTEENTSGCLLPGTTHTNNMVKGSMVAFNALFVKIKKATKEGKVFITIS